MKKLIGLIAALLLVAFLLTGCVEKEAPEEETPEEPEQEIPDVEPEPEKEFDESGVLDDEDDVSIGEII